MLTLSDPLLDFTDDLPPEFNDVLMSMSGFGGDALALELPPMPPQLKTSTSQQPIGNAVMDLYVFLITWHRAPTRSQRHG